MKCKQDKDALDYPLKDGPGHFGKGKDGEN